MEQVTRMSNGRAYWFYGSSDASRICAWCVNCGVGITDDERDVIDSNPDMYAPYCRYCQHGQTRYIPEFAGTFVHNGITVAYGYIGDEPDHDTEDCPYCDGTGDNRTDPDYSYPMPCYACGGSGISRVAPPSREEVDERDHSDSFFLF